MPTNSLTMRLGGVPLVLAKTILGIPMIQLDHYPVARDLGHNGSRSNGGAPLLTFSQGTLGKGQWNLESPIHQQEIERQGMLRQTGLHRSFHGKQRSLKNIVLLNLVGIGTTYTDDGSHVMELLQKPFPLPSRQLFGIFEDSIVTIRR